MAQHMSEPIALFLHLESSDLHTVKEFKVLIQDNLSSARDPSFLNALVDFYIQTNSFQAQDILASIREPLDKPLLDKLNECIRSPSARLPALTILSHVVRRQPSWLHKIVQAPLFASLVSCLKTDTNIPVLMCGVLTVTTLLPMIPSQVGPFLNHICEIFARLASWNVQKPGDVHDIYQLHLQAAVYALFHRLYGMYPWNFVGFLQSHYADKEKEFEIAILPMLERVRIHPQLIVGQKATETDLARWRKMEVHDILTECARVCLDTTELTRDDRSPCSQSLSESGRGMSLNTATRSNVSSASLMAGSDPVGQASSKQDTPVSQAPKQEAAALNLASQDILAAMWSPAVDCGLTTPPTSHPPSPGAGMMDISLMSSFQMGFGDPSSSLTTPRDSPHSAISEDHSQRLLNLSDASTPSKSGRKARGKVPGPLPRHQQSVLQRTTSAPSTPGYDSSSSWVPSSPIRKYSTDRTTFNFGAVRSASQQVAGKTLEIGGGQGPAGRSRQSSGKESIRDDSVAEESVQEEVEAGIRCPKPRQEDTSEEQETSVSLKDLPIVIRNLSNGQPRSDDAANAEVSHIVNSPQRDAGAFMSKVIAGLHQHKEETCTSSPCILSSSTPKYEVDKHPGRTSRGTAEGADDVGLSSEKIAFRQGQVNLKEKEDGSILNSSIGESKSDRPCQKALKAVNQKLFGAKASDGTLADPAEDALDVEPRSCAIGVGGGPTPGEARSTFAMQSGSSNQGFTPIQDHSVESTESPFTVASSSSQAFMSYAHLFPYVMPQYVFTPTSGIATPSSVGKGDDVSMSSESLGHVIPLHTMFSPSEILDRHIAMGDELHGKEQSRMPLTSQKTVNWTHYGGAPPADEIGLLRGQVQLLHNQLLYERHKREVHAGRNRRLLGKTHKAKAYEELNSAMKDTLRLQEQEIQRLTAEAKLLRQGTRQLSEDCALKDREYQQAIRKLESEKLHLTECKEELNKLLVTHRQEVDKINKDLKGSQAALFNREQELASTKADIATNAHLKDEIARLNKEILLLGEANVKYREKMEERKYSSVKGEEEEKWKASQRKELADCHDAIKQKNVQLEAAKSRISEFDALQTQRDRSIAEQKRYLENVKSLSKGKIEAIEAKYNSLKKVNQRQEGHILKLTKRISEKENAKSRRPNPDGGAQLEDSRSLGSPSLQWSGSHAPGKPQDGRDGSDPRRSPAAERRTPLGDEGEAPASAQSQSSPGAHSTTSAPQRISQTSEVIRVGSSRTRERASGTTASDGRLQQQRKESPLSANGQTPSPGLKFSEGSPFQRVHPALSGGTVTISEPVQDGGGLSSEGRGNSRVASGSGPQTSDTNRSDTVTGAPHSSVAAEQSPRDGEGSLTASGEDDDEPVCSEEQLTRLALVDNIGSGIGSQGIASLLELDTSVEERSGIPHW